MTPVQVLQRALPVSGVLSSFASKIPTSIPPVGPGVFPILNGEESLRLYLFGLGANNATFDFRIIGWTRMQPNKIALPFWVPTIIVEATATLSSTQIGLLLNEVLVTEFFADTVVVNKGLGVTPTQTGDAGVAPLICDISGYDRFEFAGNTTSSATNYNALLSFFS